jgi:hypothetical protein
MQVFLKLFYICTLFGVYVKIDFVLRDDGEE